MNDNKANTALVLGGAGFVGSNIVKKFHEAGYDISVIDGLLERTGGARENLKDVISHIDFINSKIEDVKNLDEIIDKSDIIIDCMAWTSHLLAIKDPIYDLRLNVESHLYLLQRLKKKSNKKIIYLGSRGQYGNPDMDEINEDTPMNPSDIQGIHKLAAESYFRVYSNLYGLNIISLRLPNCFGENQVVMGEDIGLVGTFIKDILGNKSIDVYGNDRKRYLLYAQDLSAIILQLIGKSFKGFRAFNCAGYEISIQDLVKLLIELIGKGRYSIKELPRKVSIMDMQCARFSDKALINFLGNISRTDIKKAFKVTMQYFKERMNDLEM